jgi:S1 RNA binding domain protein
MALEIGSIVEGRVFKLTRYGVLVELPDSKVGLIHISEVANTFVHDVADYYQVGDAVRAKVMSMGERDRVELSVKKAIGEDGVEEPQPRPGREQPVRPPRARQPRSGDRGAGARAGPQTFEDRLSSFMKKSEERQQDFRRSRDIRRRKGKR